MTEILAPYVHALTDTEIQSFRRYMSKRAGTEDMIKLLDLVRANTRTPRDMAVIIYGEARMTQFNKLRFRLRENLENFLADECMRADKTPEADVNRSLALTHLFIGRNANDLAVYYLNRAEKSAIELRSSDLLNSVYRCAIEHARPLKTDIAETAAKWKRNAKRHALISDLLVRSAEMERLIETSRLTGQALDSDELLGLIDHIDLDADEANDPAILYTIARLVRTAILPSKYFSRMGAIVKKLYMRLEGQEKFRPGDLDCRIGFLYILAHIEFRIRRFDDAEHLLGEMETLLPEEKFRVHACFARAYSLRTMIYSYTGRVQKAIAMMEDVRQNHIKWPDAGERLNVLLNLSVAYFHVGDFRSANRVIREIDASRTRLEKIKGKEWVYKRDMIQVIIHYEMGHTDLATASLQNMVKAYKPFLNQDYYKRALDFMDFVQRMMNYPEEVSAPEFRDRVRAARLGLGEREDLQAITFFCWLQSKMERRPYYDCLMERLAQDAELYATAATEVEIPFLTIEGQPEASHHP